MFKKVVSQVTFSPATVEQLAQYAQSVRSRQRLHGWAILALALVIVACGIVMLLPHNPTSTPTANDVIPGGITSVNEALSTYDKNTNHFAQTAALLSIERQDIASSTQEGCSILGDASAYYRTNILPYGDVEQHTYRLADGSPIHLRLTDSVNTSSGWCGVSSDGKAFKISPADGAILTTSLPTTGAWQEERDLSHTVSTDSISAGQLTTWTLRVSNPTDQPISQDLWFGVGDIVEYAEIVSISDSGATTTDRAYVVWPNLTLLPNETYELTIVAQGGQPLDETAQQARNENAYDCRITTVFGNTTHTPLDCPLMKQAESALHQLPPVRPMISLGIFLGLFVLNLMIYFSLRLQTKELRIIRRHLNSGGL